MNDERADHQPEDDRERPGQIPVRHRFGDDDADERRDRADRQVDVAHDDDHHHADGEYQDERVLIDDVDEVAGGQRRTVGAVAHQRGDLEEDHDHDQAAEDAELAQRGGAAASEHLLDVGEVEPALLGRGRAGHALCAF
jgi:hypothetical protein